MSHGSEGRGWWYEDPRAGRRPFLILTRDEAIPVLNQVLAVPATRTVRGIPTEVPLGASDGMPTEVPLGASDGMPTDCVLSVDNVSLVQVARCTQRITRLAPGRMQAFCEALRVATVC